MRVLCGNFHTLYSQPVGNKHKRDQVEDVQVAVSIHLSRMVLITPMASGMCHKSQVHS